MNALRITWTWLRQGWTHTHSLKGRLVCALIGLGIILVALELGQNASRLRQRDRLLRAGNERAAVNAAAVVRASLDELYRSQKIIGRNALLGRIPPEQVNIYLRDVLEQYEGLSSLQVFGPDGNLHYAAPAAYPTTITEMPWFRSLQPNSPYYLSNIDQGPNGQRVRVASLVTVNQQPLAVVSMEFAPTVLQKLLSNHLPGQVEVLLDGQGGRIYDIGAMPATAQVRQEDEVRLAIREHRGKAVEMEIPGSPRYVGFAAPVAGTAWTLVSLQDEGNALRGLDQETWRFFVVPLAVVVIVAVAIGLILNISVRPLVYLSAATRMLGSGDLAFRLPRPEVEEFEALVQSFNQMAERLQEIQSQLLEANARLAEEKDELDQRVQEATRELMEEHEKRLRAERLSTLGLFSSAIAHDLRNPLNTLALALQWLQLRLDAHPDDRVRHRITVMQSEVRRSEQIIRTLLGFARTGSPQRAPTDLNDLVRDVLAVVDPPPDATVTSDLDPRLGELSVDRAQMFQVLENLIRNAIQAMNGRGVVTVTTQAVPGGCRLRVADTGPGIPEALQATIFEPLVTTKSTGTGLGLALCKRIVEAHGGAITLESRPGEGAAFNIELPAVAAEEEAEAAPAEPDRETAAA